MRRGWRHIVKLLAMLWASPNSALGLAWGIAVRLTGGTWAWVDGALEVQGRGVGWLFDRVAPKRSIAAITLGHVVLARSTRDLTRTRRHERVHVAQYERWGPLFIPAYLVSSFRAWRRGFDAYRDNAFEVEAYAVDDCQSTLDES